MREVKIEIVGFKQDANKPDGVGIVTVRILDKENNKVVGRDERTNTTVEDFTKAASAKIGVRNVINLVGVSHEQREAQRQQEKKESQDVSRIMYSFSGRKRQRELV